MTLTETRPESAVTQAEPAPAPVVRDNWFTTSDHKKLGLLFLGFSLLFLLTGGVLLLAIAGFSTLLTLRPGLKETALAKLSKRNW